MELSPIMDICHECFATVLVNFYTASIRDIQETFVSGTLVKVPIKISTYADRKVVIFEKGYPPNSDVILPEGFAEYDSIIWFTTEGGGAMTTYMKNHFISDRDDFAYIMFSTKNESVKYKLGL